MFAHARQRCARSIARPAVQSTDSIPAFLIPARQRPAASRAFTTTSPCESKIGSQPLSVPSDVTFHVIAPSTKNMGSRVQPPSKVQIKGPLGELSMDVPHFVKIDTSPALMGPTLTIEDTTDKKQKSMWG